ncbi:MAG: S-methyl-5-thioribose-1-phosphate isomerase [Pseudanabaenaceae cyanobacterium bins.68]|nr:S-methyl-5-thioribose-1-phosphate isomerase [Pseudanabaenaceae cyanobacterium bins.68]
MTSFQSVTWRDQKLVLLDQTMLPHQTVYRQYEDYLDVVEAIATMVVRGAPAIGVAAAFGLVLAAQAEQNSPNLIASLNLAAEQLLAARPTAVNLAWAVKRMSKIWADPAEGLVAVLLAEANQIYLEDIEINRRIGEHGQAVVPDQAQVIHHCNTGALATVDYGTALGIIRIAHERGKQIHAYLDETRPRLQGAGLSAYELQAYGVPHTLIVDGAAAHVMQTRQIDLCLVGCDRVAANGDVANKIGTYGLAIAAQAHGVPFYVACPLSSIDLSLPTGAEIEIEERSGTEVTHIQGVAIAPPHTPVYNPAFDVTPAAYISGIITEKGIIYPPFSAGLASQARD